MARASKKRVLILIILVLLVIVELITSIYFVWNYKLPYDMTSDEAVYAKMAKMLADTNHLVIFEDWIHGNEFTFINGIDFMGVLFRFISDYWLVWVIGSAVTFIVLAATVFICTKFCGGNTEEGLLAIIIAFIPFVFRYSTANVLSQFYTLSYLFAILIGGWCIRYCLATNRLKVFENILFIVSSFLSGLVGLRVMMAGIVPAFLASLILLRPRKSNRFVLFGAFGSSIVGYGIYHFVLEKRYGAGAFSVQSKVQSLDYIAENIKSIPKLLIGTFKLNRFESEPIYVIFRSLIYILILACFIYYIHKRDKRVISCALMELSSFFITLISMTIFLPNYSFMDGGRYLLLSLYMVIPTFAICIGDSDRLLERHVRKLPVLLSISSIVLVLMLYVYSSIWNIRKCLDTTNMNTRMGCVAFLQDNGYRYGNASWWNAYATEFYSDGKVELHPVSNLNTFKNIYSLVKISNCSRTPEFVLWTKEEFETQYEGDYTDIVYIDDYYVIQDRRG